MTDIAVHEDVERVIQSLAVRVAPFGISVPGLKYLALVLIALSNRLRGGGLHINFDILVPENDEDDAEGYEFILRMKGELCGYYTIDVCGSEWFWVYEGHPDLKLIHSVRVTNMAEAQALASRLFGINPTRC